MEKLFFVYILRCSDDSYYTGHTDNLRRRVFEHQSVIQNCYTAVRQPVELVFFETQPTREDAVRVEAQIKRWSRKKKEALIEESKEKLRLYAKKVF